MRKWLMFGLAAVLLILAGLALLVWKGAIRINHPSRVEYPVHGVDISHYQGKIDFKALAEQDMQFAFIKATEGSTHVDECLKQNLADVQQASLRAGFYHFFSFDSPGKTQAENFISNVPALEGMLPPVIDVEYYGGYFRNPPDSARVEPELRAMVDALEQAYGMKPIIYCTLSAYHRYIKDSFADCDLWIRSVYWKPALDRDWTFWQYTDRAKLDGYDGEEPCIDVNVFNGTMEAFAKYSDK